MYLSVGFRYILTSLLNYLNTIVQFSERKKSSKSAVLHSADGGSTSDCRSRCRMFESQLVLITFPEIDHEIISTVFGPLPSIQKGQLSVTGESVCTSTG